MPVGANARHIRSRSWACQANPPLPSNACKTALISAARSDRRRDCRAVESPACRRYPVSARGSPDQCPAADTTRRRISPTYRRAARPAGRLSFLRAQQCLVAAPVALARTHWHARPQVAPSGAAASPARAGLAHSPRLTPPSTRMRERTEVSFSWEENGRSARRFPIRPILTCSRRRSRFRFCGNGSARNGPSAASGDARSG